MSKIKNDGLTRTGTGCFIAVELYSSTLFTVLSFCACCYSVVYICTWTLFSFYATGLTFYVLCNGVRMSHCIKGYL